MKTILNALAVSAVLLSTLGFAQTSPKAAPAAMKDKMAMPPPPTMTPEGKKFLESMVGHWAFNDLVMKMGDHEMKGTFTFKCEKAAMGWVTECKGVQDMGKAQPKVEGIYLLTWDVVTGEGHMLEADSMGTVHNHAGKWSDDKTISLVHNGKNLEGKDETDTITFTYVSPKEMTMKADGKSGATINWSMSATGKKTEGAAPPKG